MKRVNPDIPAELAAYLRAGRAFDYDPTTCEAGRVTLLPLGSLAVRLFPTDVQSSAIEHEDPHRGELGCYMVPAVDLVQTAENYEPTGLLLWLPTEQRFGTWDSSHPWIAVFGPEVTWSDIAAAPARFINAQWEGAFDDAAPTAPLIPWPHHVYRTEQFFEPEPLPVEEPTTPSRRLYRYVGPEDIRQRSEGKDGGDIVSSTQIVRDWATRTGQAPNAEGLIRSTYVVDEQGRLRVADYGSEHVACALGGRVLAAGVAWFEITKKSVSVDRIDNLSTGYCPEPACWEAVQVALDQAGIPHSGHFTTEIIFRLCTACGQRNIVRDEWYHCAVCDAELPRVWNFDDSRPRV